MRMCGRGWLRFSTLSHYSLPMIMIVFALRFPTLPTSLALSHFRRLPCFDPCRTLQLRRNGSRATPRRREERVLERQQRQQRRPPPLALQRARRPQRATRAVAAPTQEVAAAAAAMVQAAATSKKPWKRQYANKQINVRSSVYHFPLSFLLLIMC